MKLMGTIPKTSPLKYIIRNLFDYLSIILIHLIPSVTFQPTLLMIKSVKSVAELL
jgi:hypothetical protein